jgi:hypothetical protein
MCLVLRASSDADGMRYGDGLGKVPGLRRIGCSQDHMQNPHPLKPEGAAPKSQRRSYWISVTCMVWSMARVG